MPFSCPPYKPTLQHLRSLQHSGGGLWVTHLFHRAGVLLAWLYSRAGMSPNAITLFSGFISAAASIGLVLVDRITPGLAVLAFLIQAFAYASDCSDGQLARATGRCTTFGAWLDHVVDAWKMLVIHFSLGWIALGQAAVHGIPGHWAFLALVFGLGGTSLYFFGWNYKVMLVGKDMIGNAIPDPRRRRLLLLPLQITDFGIFIVLFLLLAWQPLFIWAYLGYAALCACIFAAYLGMTMLRFPKDRKRDA